MANGDPSVERGKGRAHRGRGVALDEDEARPLGGEHRIQTEQCSSGENRERLILGHELQIEVRLQTEGAQRAVEEVAMLPCGDEPWEESPSAPAHLEGDRGELDRLGARAEDDQDTLTVGQSATTGGRACEHGSCAASPRRPRR